MRIQNAVDQANPEYSGPSKPEAVDQSNQRRWTKKRRMQWSKQIQSAVNQANQISEAVDQTYQSAIGMQIEFELQEELRSSSSTQDANGQMIFVHV